VLDRTGAVRRVGGLDAALAALAADVLDLHGDADRELLSRCADPRCTRPFVDRSRGRRRRWCGMRGCGDRAKAAAYRARRRG
jgi:predicted RNA-binding Zn ribbon-like protein